MSVGRAKTLLAAVVALSIGLGAVVATAPGASAAPVGQGFTVTTSDLAFILKQIKIAERHARAVVGDPGIPVNPNPTGDPNYCQALVGPGPDQIPDRITSYGLRTVDGSCNNLFPGRDTYAAADLPFPRLTTPSFKAAESITASLPVGAPGPTSYAQKQGSVVDSQPRVISNLIADQTSTNPAAVAAAEFPVRSQGNPGKYPCTTDPDPMALPEPIDGVPAGCVPSHQTLDIPNVTTDVGLSPPYNSLFTFFGQFFDHGVDQTVKSGSAVFVPLRADDPLIAGADHAFGTADDLPKSQRFMVLTRAQNQPGADGVLGTADDIQNAKNTDTPWVDQSQTYTSHASHQVFLREYVMNVAGRPVSTGKLLGGLPAGQTYANSPDGTTAMATWAAVKQQAASKLGLELVDADVTNVPMIATDPYGKFIPGARGLPQYVTSTDLVEGDLDHPVPVPANVLHFDTPFLTDIAHNADPSPQDTDNNPMTSPVAPKPDADTSPSADFARQSAGTYDDEMLNAHFACGDGRCNENIALSTIHQVFHSEHDRLVDDIKTTLTNDTSTAGVAALAQWKLAAGTTDGWNGERLFQAARFVTEMEYQHIVFEEFARKIQPAVAPFHVYSPDINATVKAEFAHAVYRFGHSMLDDTVARTNVDLASGAKTDNSVPLLTAFLNPPEFFNGGKAGTLTPARAAGAIVMGSSSQVGNELDEFVTESLRSNLLGLPLDLATLNLARAREAGVASLNSFRRQLFAQTNDGQLTPYKSWSDLGQHLKHPESLINFVAAYGTHPTIRDAGPDGVPGNADDVTTVAAKRAAAKLIVDPADPTNVAIPGDAAEFMFGTGSWANSASGVTTTGLDQVDLWIGGLAEVTNLNGGLLGRTFNYVFQTQLENLQDGDRYYYLARTPGMNLRSQLEGNSFAELIQRNTDGTESLKADAFATADCRFQLANLAGSPAGFSKYGSAVADDPTTTDCNENKLLLRTPDGTIQYRLSNPVDRSGLNGQAVYSGSDAQDRVTGGVDNDTFWGGKGNDVIDGNGGDDVALGGVGNDIITDFGGADVLKGGPGNDAVDGGPDNDIVFGGDGQDVLNGGANDNEAFGGPGSDFIIAGQGADAVFGDGGDDWIQGGTGQDLLQGDHGAPFFDDPAQTAPGNDIFVGQPGENDYDAEGGDDIMAQNAAVDRNAGAGGFDWATHQYDTVGADDDMEINNNLVGVPIQVVVNRDRWQEVEADSGSAFDDVIKGTSVAPSSVGGDGFIGCDALDAAGVARIAGLDQLVSTFSSPLAPIVAASAPGACPLNGSATGGNVWGEGDILIGGLGSDTITGRGANDIIDGDRSLQVRISVRSNPTDPASEIGSTDLMEHQYLRDGNGALTGPTLQAAVFAGTVDPGNLVAVREIVTPSASAAAGDLDTAVFSGPLFNYSVTADAGKIIVSQTGTNFPGQKVSDGTDILTNVEVLQFSDQTIRTADLTQPPGIPTIVGASATPGSATVEFTPPTASDLAPLTGFTIRAVPVAPSTAPVVTSLVTDTTATMGVVNGLLTDGTSYQLQVAATNGAGTGAFSALSASVTPAPPAAPLAVLAPTALTFNGTVGLTSSPQTVTLSNTGSAALAISGLTLAGTDAADFTVKTTTCGTTLAPGTSCATSITFTPRAAGVRSGLFTVAHNASASPQTIPVTGNGTAAPDTKAPTQVALVPAAGATKVATSADLSATFSEAVRDVNATTFTVRAGTAAAVAATVTQVGTSNQWTLNPTANLAAGTVYLVTLTGGSAAIRDLAGNPLTTTSWSFTTAAATDTTPPTVTARTPAVNGTSVAVGSDMTATFSEAVTGVNGTNATLRLGTATTGTLIPAAVSYNATTRTITLNPNASLAADTKYTVRLVAGIRDSAANALVPVTWSFVTGPAPTVTARTPGSNATSVAVGSNITATFSEAVTGVTATNATLRVGTSATGTLISAVVTYNTTTRVLTLNPNANLASDTRYTVRLAAGITDSAGNPLVALNWSFVTGPAPSVTARTPGVNATKVSRTGNVTATISEAVTRVTSTTATLRLGTSATGTLIASAVTYNATTRLITINPSATLASNTVYTVRLSGIVDVAGNPLPPTTWSFTTGTA